MLGNVCGWYHVVTLAAVCRYLRNRELVLGTYLVLSAAVTAYTSHSEAVQLESQSALASLVWFSRAQSAEPLMLKSIIFAVSPLCTLRIATLAVVAHQKGISRHCPWLLCSQAALVPSLQGCPRKKQLARKQSSLQSQDLVLHGASAFEAIRFNERLMSSPPHLLLSCLPCCSCASGWSSSCKGCACWWPPAGQPMCAPPAAAPP